MNQIQKMDSIRTEKQNHVHPFSEELKISFGSDEANSNKIGTCITFLYCFLVWYKIDIYDGKSNKTFHFLCNEKSIKTFHTFLCINFISFSICFVVSFLLASSLYLYVFTLQNGSSIDLCFHYFSNQLV